MPCAARELYEHPELTPEAPSDHASRGMCVGRLHGTCGEVEDPDGDNNEINPICNSYFSKKAEATRYRSRAGKRKATSAGNLEVVDMRGCSVTGGDWSKHAKACTARSKSRVRLNLDQKRQVLEVLTQRVSHAKIARRFKLCVQYARGI